MTSEDSWARRIPAGRDFRLTDVEGHVVRDVLA